MKIEHSLLTSRFGKLSPTYVKQKSTSNVVVYTRVSTKEQADKNLSLSTQKRTIEEFANRHSLNIVSFFGGTYESAKTDGRKEFKRMLEFIKSHKGQVSQILVYTLDRFSRTGGAAIKLASDLREKHGISVFAVTQPTDTSNPSGVLHQNIQLLFSEFDNQQRRQRVIAGMTEKFKQGIWVVKPPQGYDIITINGIRSIVVNDDGKQIRKAFGWKAEGIRNDEIVSRLNNLGLHIYKQQIHKILVNPFYCGLIAHGMLNGQVVEGKHEAMISKELFLKVNNIISESPRFGVPHKAENHNIPLKVFMKCSECGEPFTGYIVKARGIHYYKCRTNGCKCNKNAEQVNKLFSGFLDKYTLTPNLIKPFLYQIEHKLNDFIKNQVDTGKVLKMKLTEVTTKLDGLEEKYHILNQISEEVFQKFHPKYKEEEKQIQEDLAKLAKPISNNGDILNKATDIALKLPQLWGQGEIRLKEQLQKLVFPEGIVFDRKNEAIRTNTVNPIFALICQLVKGSGDNEKGTTPFLIGQSLSAERGGFEPPVHFWAYDSLANCSFRPLRHLS